MPYIFGLVHDSRRLDKGTDPEHGPRAAAFYNVDVAQPLLWT
ncbi:hypothetical protein QTI24_30605 [Variovorax sp. J22P240]|nr:hypothetical protein [Variovorax sp. J22P240]MDM0002974.1 hypothetical protein [Variovorax sp. J22P240]